jgi:hypothetical protein
MALSAGSNTRWLGTGVVLSIAHLLGLGCWLLVGRCSSPAPGEERSAASTAAPLTWAAARWQPVQQPTGRSARGCGVPAHGAAGEAGPCPRPPRWAHVELPAGWWWPGPATRSQRRDAPGGWVVGPRRLVPLAPPRGGAPLPSGEKQTGLFPRRRFRPVTTASAGNPPPSRVATQPGSPACERCGWWPSSCWGLGAWSAWGCGCCIGWPHVPHGGVAAGDLGWAGEGVDRHPAHRPGGSPLPAALLAAHRAAPRGAALAAVAASRRGLAIG